MEDLLLIDIPDFSVEYESNMRCGYSSKKARENLRKALERASKGYCMYCYKRIVVDGNRQGHLEHAIEKDFSDKLVECVPNIGIACGTCNLSYKKEDQQHRRISEDEIRIFERGTCHADCTQPCSQYDQLKSVYLNNEAAHIILQPHGVRGKETENPLKLQYDILRSKFQASNKYKYSECERGFIEDHIRRFRLNGEQEKTRQLIAFLKDTIDNDGYYSKMEYNHYIVELFAGQLRGKTRSEILKICSFLYIKAVSKFHSDSSLS